MADTVRHAWLDLITTDGPFLSRPALIDELDDAWPPRIDPEVRNSIGPDASASWPADTGAAVDAFLIDVLGYRPGKTLDTTRHTVTHSTYASSVVEVHAVATTPSKPGKSGEPRMVILSAADFAPTPDRFDPEMPTATGGVWKPTPVQRATLAARSLDVPLALVTDGRRNLVVWTGSGVAGWGWIDPATYRLDRRLADAVVALLSPTRVCTRTDTSTADLLRISQDRQAELTDTLGIQVRRAAEAIVNALSRANRSDPRLLKDVDSHEVYAGVVTVLMRTVFLLNAEEKGLIGTEGMWADDYAVSTLLDQLDDDYARHPGLLSQRYGAWARLLAAARVVHGGVDHSQMNIYGYGGGLFDPSRRPFLEGQTVDGVQLDTGLVDDATIRHVLDLLQRLDGDRISYRTLTVEQVGQVYEHLLDHSAVIVPDDSVVLGLDPPGVGPEIAVAELREHHTTDAKLAKWIADTHDHGSGDAAAKKKRWLKRLAADAPDAVQATISQACRNRADVLEDVRPFLGMLGADARGVAKVFLPGDVYVTETSTRRDSGTSYTSPVFAAEIAKHALRHLVYCDELPTDDDPEEGLKSPDEILDLKVCDPAVGSGAILVAAVRYLADRLVASRKEHGEAGKPSAADDRSATDAHVQAARDVVANCIYAVDRDPMAVEMTKLSLWLITMAKNRPFTFVDHAIRSGDSLLGVTDLDQLRRLHLAPKAQSVPLDVSGAGADLGDYFTTIDTKIAKALELRAQVRAGDVVHADEAAKREKIAARADRILDDLRLVADAITASCYTYASRKATDTDSALHDHVLSAAADLENRRGDLARQGTVRPDDATSTFEFFHWAIEYPEVMQSGGFDAMVGNPPFQGGKKISTSNGKSYRQAIVRYVLAGQSQATTDLVAFFFRRASTLARSFGFIATNSVAQGDTSEQGLLPIVGSNRGLIHRADSNMIWPGRDAVFVARVWWSRTTKDFNNIRLDGISVGAIDAGLYPAGQTTGRPYDIPPDRPVSVGVFVRGAGFVLEPEERDRIAAAGSGSVIRPYVSGEDLNRSPRLSISRYVIDMTGTESIYKAKSHTAAFSHLESTVRLSRSKASGRAKNKWWLFAGPKTALNSRLEELDYAIAVARVSPHGMPIRVKTGPVFSDACVVFPWDDYALLGLISSTIHRIWVDRHASTMKADVRYSPSDCFLNFPLPGRLVSSAVASGDGLRASRGNDGIKLFALAEFAAEFNSWREATMVGSGEGITSLYGRYHDPSQREVSAESLRQRHIEMDRLVAASYGWEDLKLGHDFHETRYGTFFTVSTEVRFELLLRLLELNFTQYAERTGRPLDQVKREAQAHG